MRVNLIKVKTQVMTFVKGKKVFLILGSNKNHTTKQPSNIERHVYLQRANTKSYLDDTRPFRKKNDL